MNPAPAVLGFPEYDYERWIWVPWTHSGRYRKAPRMMIAPMIDTATRMMGRRKLGFPASFRSRPFCSSHEPTRNVRVANIAMTANEIGMMNLSTLAGLYL